MKKGRNNEEYKKSTNMKTIVVGEKCNESIRIPFLFLLFFKDKIYDLVGRGGFDDFLFK